MTRSNAREIAVHLIYAARGSEIPVEELIDRRFEQTYYACLGSENEVYQEKPGNKQMSYIRSAVKGVFEHIDESIHARQSMDGQYLLPPLAGISTGFLAWPERSWSSPYTKRCM